VIAEVEKETVMDPNHVRVLEMLAEGKVTVEEATRLLSALDNRAAAASPVATASPAPGPAPKYLRVIVDGIEPGKGPVKVNVRVPLQLLRAGVKLASLIPASAQEKLNDELRRNGVNFDISQVKPENIDELIRELHDLTIDVDHEHDQVKVRIFTE
jgi:hypothetical protein